MQLQLTLDRSIPGTLTAQLIFQICDAIKKRRIAPGARLPSSRQLARQLGLSRNTVVRAYEIICSEGYAEGRPASGIFASLDLPETITKPHGSIDFERDETIPETCMPLPHLTLLARPADAKVRSRLTFDFFPGQTHAGLFPIKTWRRILQACLSHGGSIGLSQYGDPAGLQALRLAIATHVAASRGIVADPGRIVIVSGAREAINISAALFLGPGRTAVIENPCYAPALSSFEARNATISLIAVDEDGLRVEDLSQGATLAYVTPGHQYPTGVTLVDHRRAELIRWARHNGCYILEDDYDCDLRYEGSTQPALAASAPDCTIYIGTFSKTLGAGLRLGYMIVPPKLAESACAAKELMSNANSWLEQAALAEFIRSGSYAAYLIRARAFYLERRNALLSALCRNFGRVRITGEEAGLHVFWRLPQSAPDVSIIEPAGRRARVGIYAMKSCHAQGTEDLDDNRRSLVLGFGALSPLQIDEGITRLASVIQDVQAQANGADAAFFGQVPLIAQRSNLAHQTHQQPALGVRARAQALSSGKPKRARSASMPQIKSLYRYPIKGLSAQPVSGVRLEPGQPFPFDRVLALARPGSPVDGDDPKWAKKGQFVMLMLDEALAQVKTHLDVETLKLTVTRGNQQLLIADLNNESDRAEVEEYFYRLVSTLRAAPKLVQSRGGHFMDKPDAVISLINLATVRSLEEQWGFEIDPLRFRANLYIDNANPWEEFDWIGHDLQIGEAIFRVDRRNGRCGATNVNPVTGRRDLDIPGSLRTAFGHKDVGVYIAVRRGGMVAVGDALRTAAAPTDRTSDAAGSFSPRRGKRYICGGCYFIYEEDLGLTQQGISAGTRFLDLPASWVCPDCGTDRGVFRPYVK
jgi:GntR family transcriptional regulator / MocR family aminotransferase